MAICKSEVTSFLHAFTYSFIHPPIHPPTHSSIHSPTHSSIHLSTHPPTHSSVHSSTHSTIHSPSHSSIHLSIHPPIHPTTHSSIQSSTHPPTHSLTFPFTHSFIHLLIYSPSQSLICYQVNTCPLTPCEPDTEWTLGIPGHRGRHSPPSLSGSGPVGRRTVKLVSQGLPRREAALRSRCGRVNWVPRGSFGPSSLLWRQSQALKFSVATPLRPPFSLLAHQERPEVGEIGGAAH